MDDDWDAICVNPHEAFVAQGREEGREAGREAGFVQGRQLGQTTAIDYGMELGFIQGVLEELGLHGDELSSKNDRAVKTMKDLQQALDRFPQAEAIFQQHQELGTDLPATDDLHDDSEQPQAELAHADVRQLLQRIRARFRLLMVQLHLSSVSLPQVMADVTTDNSPAIPPPTVDW
jgi:hypothetical protein